jgi:magnesium-transporting ATPase (P-type)
MNHTDHFNFVMRIFGLILIVLIIILGLMVIFSSYFNNLPKNFKFIFAFLILSYGGFRLVNIINNSKKREDD